MSDLIDRQAAIDYLVLNMGWHDEDGYPVDDTEEKRGIITELLSGIPSAEPHWIPCSERLPEENRTVIASTEYEVFPEARYTKEDGWEWAYESGADYWEKITEVKAWIPLPKPYEVKECKD